MLFSLAACQHPLSTPHIRHDDHWAKSDRCLYSHIHRLPCYLSVIFLYEAPAVVLTSASRCGERRNACWGSLLAAVAKNKRRMLAGLCLSLIQFYMTCGCCVCPSSLSTYGSLLCPPLCVAYPPVLSASGLQKHSTGFTQNHHVFPPEFVSVSSLTWVVYCLW